MTDNTFLNAVVGALVSIVLVFTALSPVLGGGAAAWLEDGDRDASIRVGALSGLIAVAVTVPPVLLAGLFGLALVPIGALPIEFGLLFVALAAVAASVVVGLSALGGYLAHYVRSGPDVAAGSGSRY